jgi:hypothetical protein
MKLKIQYDERETTETKYEEATIPSTSPYRIRTDEVPDPDNGVEIRRISQAAKTGTGSGACASGGVYTGLSLKNYKIQIDTAGDVGGSATFKWSNDGGQTWQGVLIPIEDEDPIQVEMGITVKFSSGDGTDFELGDYWTFTAEWWTKVGYVPTQSKEYYVNYRNGNVTFHSSDASKTVQVSYEGRGSLVDAEDVNQLIEIANAGEVAIRNLDTSAFSATDCVGLDSNGAYIRANATDDTEPAFGFVKTVDAESGEVVTFGPLDGFAGLTPGAVYYLDTVDGEITATAPSGSGSIKQKVGRAMTTTKLFVRISDEITVNS